MTFAIPSNPLWSMTHRREPERWPFAVAIRGDSVDITHTGSGAVHPQTPSWVDARRLGQLLQDALAAGASTIAVDLELDADVDTSLIAVLIDARRRARHSGADLTVHETPALQNLAKICRVDGVLHLV